MHNVLVTNLTSPTAKERGATITNKDSLAGNNKTAIENIALMLAHLQIMHAEILKRVIVALAMVQLNVMQVMKVISIANCQLEKITYSKLLVQVS